jgi:ABC-type phosphate transport system auxiliary subunit
MQIDKKYFLPVVALTVLSGATVFGASMASAHGQVDGDTLVEKLATKFHVKTEDVQAVFDENRAEHEANREKEREARLAQLVIDGKLTEDQKNALIAKHQEMEAKRDTMRDSLKDATPEERKTAMEQHRAEMDQWFKDQGIDRSILHPAGDGRMDGGRGGHGFRGDR